MERYECAVAVPLRELRSLVERDRIRGPMRRENRDRLGDVRASSNGLSIAAVFGREHLRPLDRIVVTVGPAVVRAFGDTEHLFGGDLRALLVREQRRPIAAQIVAAVLHDEQRARLRMDGEPDGVPDTGSESAAIAGRLSDAIRVEDPDPRASLQRAARIGAART